LVKSTFFRFDDFCGVGESDDADVVVRRQRSKQEKSDGTAQVEFVGGLVGTAF
jgi:hypothetical protein